MSVRLSSILRWNYTNRALPFLGCRHSRCHQVELRSLRDDLRSVSVRGYCAVPKERPPIPKSARVVVCGGGISGCSVAYHLAQLGWTDVVVLERASITSGSTWHAAGLIRRLRGTSVETQCAKISCQLYSSLEAISGHATGFRECGSLLVAQTKDRMISYQKIVTQYRIAGMDAELLGVNELKEYHPLIFTDDLVGGVFVPDDSCANPSDVCQSLVKAAQQKGAQFFENIDVQKILTINGRIYGVQTNQGYIKCEYFVNCGGMWGRDVGLLSQPVVNVPLYPCEHYYLITQPFSEINTRNFPTLRDQDGNIYAREWSGGLLVGAFEPKAKPAFLEGIPKHFEYQMLQENWDHFQPMLDNMLKRIPRLGQAEVRQLFNGPESFTPDTRVLMGEVPEIRNYFVAAGYNSSGIGLGGGAGSIIAEWIVNGAPSLDISLVDIKRFFYTQNNKAFLRDRVTETVGLHYTIRHPLHEFSNGRKLHCSPLYPRLEAAGAVFGEKAGWERPLYVKETESDDFLDDDGDQCQYKGLFGKPPWLEIVKSEYKGCRDGVGVLDMSSFAKFELKSPGNEATNLLQYLCCSDIDRPIGNIVHTGMLNSHGCYENDCSVVRLDHNQVIDIGYASGVRALTMTHCGEKGWMLYIPNEMAIPLYDNLMEHGKNYGVLNIGYIAYQYLRIEKFFTFQIQDFKSIHTPFEAGRAFQVKLEKDIDFIGRKALAAQKNNGITQRIVFFLLEDHDIENDLWPWGGEAIYRNGQFTGLTTSVGCGFTLNRMVGFGWVTNVDEKTGEHQLINNEYVMSGHYEIEIVGKKYPAKPRLYTPLIH
ncbi:pyruvate dehydrogenase phosphatase regulatory subunit, mitochondrial-like [Saccoglossus kowalevskii]